MKLTVQKPTEIEADTIRCVLPFYDDDEVAADFPGRAETPGDRVFVGTITLVLDLATATVRDWPAGRVEHLFLKVRGSGVYTLLAGAEVLATRKSYVPDCVPSNGGDYAAIWIAADGAVFENNDGRQGSRWAPDTDEIVDDFFGGEGK